ncbi:MAG: Spo0E family sporulation regulatory protein-aspartic acid phosphatase, partial [Bacillota bacterium]
MRWGEKVSIIVNAVGQTEDLLECIIKKRKEMIDLGMNYGLLDEKTIQCSQYLDELINL